MSRDSSLDLLRNYYEAFNSGDMKRFLSYLDPEIIHDVNEGKSEVGISAFQAFMDRMNACYKEHLVDIRLMSDSGGENLAARFIVEGTYLKTDAGLPEARGQKYRIPAGAFFEVKNNRIRRMTMYYNLADWIKQVQ